MKTKLLSIVSVIKGSKVMFCQKQAKCIISFLTIIFFSLSIMLFNHHEAKAAEASQISPNITWAQGGLSGLRWGMSKKEVERVLGVRLSHSFYDNFHNVTQYTTNLTTTWIKNTRIDFSCKKITSEISFHHDKLFYLWFCTNRPPISIISSKFGPGAPDTTYPNDNDRREWWDAKTKLEASNANGGDVMISDWRESDKIYERDHSDDYEWYLHKWRRQHAK